MDITKAHLRIQGMVLVALLGIPTGMAFLMWAADGSSRVGFTQAHIISVRYIMAVLIQMVLIVPVFVIAKRRPPGTLLTWGEAMVGAVYVFGVLFWLYGVLPHEFLNWADSELAWRPDKKIIGPEGSWAEWFGFWKNIPLTITKETIRDVVAVVIYTIGLGGFMWMCKFWNDREKNATATKAIEPVSRYGRPLVAKAGKS